MDYSFDNDHGFTATVGDIIIHVTSYDVSRRRKYYFQPLTTNEFYMVDQGKYPTELILRGKVLVSEDINVECQLSSDITNDVRYFLTVDKLYFNAARLESFKISRVMNSKYVECELKFICESNVEEAANV